MSSTLRILFVAETDAGVQALSAARQGGPVQGHLAPSADALRRALLRPDAADAWDAVVYVPGGPVEEVEVAVFVPDGVPLFVIDDEVPLLLTGTAAQALPLAELAQVRSHLPAQTAPAASASAEAAEPEADEAGPSPAAPPAVAPSPALPAADPSPAASAGGVDLTSLVEELSVALYRSTPEGKILYANPALAELLGAPSTEALESIDVWTDLGYPRQRFADEIHGAGAVRNLVMSWTRHTGERVHTRETARTITDDAGQVLYYEGIMEDVTAEVEAQRRSPVKRTKYEGFLRNMENAARNARRA